MSDDFDPGEVDTRGEFLYAIFSLLKIVVLVIFLFMIIGLLGNVLTMEVPLPL